MARKKNVKSRAKTHDKQAYWIIFGMVVLISGLLLFWYLTLSSHNFEYKGLSFTRERAANNLIVYHYYYHFKDETGQLYRVNLYLRGDPRKNSVPFDGTTSFAAGKEIIYSVDNSIVPCDNSSLALAEISDFFANNFMKIRGATQNITEANLTGMRYANCETNPKNPVIMIQAGNTTSIVKTGTNCYVMDVANCEILQAAEKFIVKSILDAKGSS